jgi:putative DNA primase/helicase
VLVSIQFIAADGTKKFKAGGKKKGCDCRMGKYDPAQPIVVCEGWATGCSIHQATGLHVVVAFDAGNLVPVVERLRTAHPDAVIAIAGDDDAFKPENGNKGAAVVEAVCAAFDCVAVTFGLNNEQSNNSEVAA